MFARILAALLLMTSPVLTSLVLTTPAHAADKLELESLDRVMGKDDAPLTVIEYASLTCPHCAHFHENVMPKLKAEWIDTGKAKLIYRDLPTGPVNLSIAGAMVTQCAPKDHYFPLLDLLFRSQDRWLGSPHPLDELKRVVGLAGITPADVDACLAKRDLGDAIQTRAQLGTQQFGIESTPSLVIGGKVYAGVQSYDALKPVLERALADATKK